MSESSIPVHQTLKHALVIYKRKFLYQGLPALQHKWLHLQCEQILRKERQNMTQTHAELKVSLSERKASAITFRMTIFSTLHIYLMAGTQNIINYCETATRIK